MIKQGRDIKYTNDALVTTRPVCITWHVHTEYLHRFHRTRAVMDIMPSIYPVILISRAMI